MSDLNDFHTGFHDGYRNQPRDTRGGITYQRAYRAGQQAAKRDREWASKENQK